MKKVLSVLLCLTMVLAFAACGGTKIGELKEFEIGDYKLNLPATYELNDLKEVKAEPSCIAMLTDSKGKLPDLWIYEDALDGATLKEHIINLDDVWDFNEISYYSKNGAELARTVYNEDWYGEKLLNENYYRIAKGTKVLGFDFAYPKASDAENAHKYIVAIAEALGFQLSHLGPIPNGNLKQKKGRLK